MREVVVLIVAALLTACDVVTDHYATLTDARADSLFERGWLPDILPPSSHDIRTSNDVATNFSSGEFHFSPQEFPQLAASLRPYAQPKALTELDNEVSQLTDRGFTPYEYTTADTVWLFLCDSSQGFCVYRMWPQLTTDV
jgi:hypothetical protein